jgi:hypothetical protein
MAAIIEEVAKFILRLIFEFLFAWTGEIVLFIVTLGRHKPRWDLYTKESPMRFVLFSDISLWIGMAFWVVVVAVLYAAVAKG